MCQSRCTTKLLEVWDRIKMSPHMRGFREWIAYLTCFCILVWSGVIKSSISRAALCQVEQVILVKGSSSLMRCEAQLTNEQTFMLTAYTSQFAVYMAFGGYIQKLRIHIARELIPFGGGGLAATQQQSCLVKLCNSFPFLHRYITLMGRSHHLISQAGWNRCNLSICLR